MIVSSRKQGLVIVGAGPGGLAPLFAYAGAGRLRELLDRGVTILERGQVLGAGALGTYAIRSDSSAETLLSIVLRSREPSLRALASHPVTEALARFGKEAAPLRLAGLFLELAGTALCEAVAASRWGSVLRGVTASWVRQDANGLWQTRFSDAGGRIGEITSSSVLLATGAHQPRGRLYGEVVAGECLLPQFENKLMQSGEVLVEGGKEEAAGRLRGVRDPRVVIVGGSTSSASVALALLTRVRGVSFRPGGVTLLHRSPLRISYETPEAALAEGYTEFTSDDICPLTRRVFRLAGFRQESRELIMQARGIGGRFPEPRLRLLKLEDRTEAEARQALQEADLIVAALGYRPKLLPVFDRDMRPVPLRSPAAERWAAVDASCRVVTANDTPLPGLFAAGLAVGPAASRQLGGEAGFQGQVNSLWLWQHTLGGIIADGVVQRADALQVMAASASTQGFPLPAGVLSPQTSSITFAETAGAR